MPTNNAFLLRPMAITESGLASLVDGRFDAAITSKTDTPKTDATKAGTVGVLNIYGPIVRQSDFFTAMMGFPSTDAIGHNFQALMSDDKVKAIVLNIDSPGGGVAGIHELSTMIYQARGRKPITAHISGAGASAAYWIASAADKITIDATGQAGSIGVVYGSRAKDDDRIEITSTASPKKRLDPASKEGRADILAQVDAIAEVMIADIARNRGVTVEKVIADYGQGSVLVGKNAVESGLADRVGGFVETLIDAKAKGEKQMTYEEFMAAHAEHIGTLKADLDGQMIEKIKNARVDEQAALMAMVEVFFSAEDVEKFKAVLAAGVNAEQFKAIQAVQPKPVKAEPKDDIAEKAAMLAALKATGAENPGLSGKTADEPQEFMAYVDALSKKEGISKGAAVRKAVTEKPDLHEKYINSLN